MPRGMNFPHGDGYPDGHQDFGSPRAVRTAERRAEALAMRKRGMTYKEIADALGYKSATTVSSEIKKMLTEMPRENADQLRKIEVERMDQLLNAMWDKAMGGDGWAVDRCLKIMERRAKLLGLDAPIVTKVEVVTEDVIDSQIQQLEREMRMMRNALPESAPRLPPPMTIESQRADRPTGGE